jgi:serine/threonine protein kinase
MKRATKIRPLKPGTKVKEWTVLKSPDARCGSGTYGEVWKARHRLGMTVAIKSFAHLARVVQEDKLLSEILREALAQGHVEHENVVGLIDIEETKGCIICEYLPTSLEKLLRMRKGEQFPPETAMGIFKGILEGLQAIHASNRVHGDLKPANILMTEKDTPKISDFGMASILDAKKFPVPFFHGSNNWAAPEVLSGGKPDFQSDLFSIGIIGYLLFTLQHPFYCADPTCLSRPEDYIKDVSWTVKPPNVINQLVPDTLSQILVKLLERDREKRYKTVGEILMELSLNEAPSPASPPPGVGAANDIAAAIVEAKRQFHALFQPPNALVVLAHIIDKYATSNLPFLANAYSYKAFVNNYLKQWDEAIDAASQGIKLDPNHSDSYMARGYAYEHRAIDRKNPTDFEHAREDLTNAKLLSQDYRTRQQAQNLLDELDVLTAPSKKD